MKDLCFWVHVIQGTLTDIHFNHKKTVWRGYDYAWKVPLFLSRKFFLFCLILFAHKSLSCLNKSLSIITAIVTLQEGEKAIEIASALDKKHLLNTEVCVSFYPSDKLLCVAHLPSGFTENNFEALVSTCGPVEKAFLMRHEFTGNVQ